MTEHPVLPAAAVPTSSAVIQLAVSRIAPHPDNPRQVFSEGELKELAANIACKGIVQPLVVLPPDGDGIHLLLVGERRWRSAQIAGLSTVPCLVRDKLTPAEILEFQLLENLARVDLRPLEVARALERLLILRGGTAAEIAVSIGMNPSAVSRSLALLRLPERLQQAVEEGTVAASVAVSVGAVKDESKRVALAGRVIEQEMTRECVLAEIARLNREEHSSPAKTRARRVAVQLPDGLQVSIVGLKDQELDADKLISGLELMLRECKKARQQGLPLRSWKDQFKQPEKATASA